MPLILQEAVQRAGERPEIVSLAQALGVPPEVVVLALIAGLEGAALCTGRAGPGRSRGRGGSAGGDRLVRETSRGLIRR